MSAPVTLDSLASAARWVGWRNEKRNNGITKVPYIPGTRVIEARSDDPATWGAQTEAAHWASRYVNGEGGGVGIMLGEHDGIWLAGIDLDTCRAAEGTMEPWAITILDKLSTYAEVSPSGNGVKAFFLCDAGEVKRLREAMGTLHSRVWKNGGGNHAPGIELHISHRYFTVTGDALPAMPNELRHVPTETLHWLIEHAGPRFKRNGTIEDAAQPDDEEPLGILARIEAVAAFKPALRQVLDRMGAYGSRSESAMALGGALRRAGFDYAEMCDVLRAHSATADWAAEKGDTNGGRELRRIWEKAAGGPAANARPDGKRPLTREMPPAPEFPGDALGPLRKAAEALHEAVQVPFAIAAQSVLAAATLAVQPHRDMLLPGVGRRPLTGLFATVAESGERKSSCDRLALRAVHRFEEGLREKHGPALDAFRADREAWKAATEAARKKGKGDRAMIREALNAIGAEPKPPPHPMLLVADPTPEALVLHLQDGRPWGGLFTDEGGVLIGGHAMNDDNRMRTGALLNNLWDGAAIRRLRVGSGSCFLPGRRVSAHVMMQGYVASRFFGDETLDGIGTLARVLTVAPETAAGTRLFRATTEAAELALQDYDARLMALLTRRPRTKPDAPDVLDPEPLPLSPDARNLWIAFHDECERDMAPTGELATIRAFASKLAEHAGRLAGVLATYADPDALEVDAEHMACGIALAQHYASELLRLGEAAAVAPDLRLAQRLLTWWQGRSDPRCHLAAVYQRGLNAIGNAATARRIIAILEEHGWVIRLPAGEVLDGSPHRDAWTLAP